jgi:hypothetical protein
MTTDPRLTARLLPGSRLAALGVLLATTEKTQPPPMAPAGETPMPTPLGDQPPPPPPEPVSAQGWPVIQQLVDAVYVRLPKELQRPTGGCSCAYCKAHPKEVPMWDTLAIPLGPVRNRTTWTVHAPEWRYPK